METKASLRRIVWSVTYVILALLGLRMATGTESAWTQQDGRFIPITINGQLEPKNGVIPVEIQCGRAHLSSPNTLERIDCSLKNNSAKPVSAANVIYTVTLQTSGGASKESFNRTFDALIHPDFRLSNQLVGPGEQTDLGTAGPTSYFDGLIDNISIATDYVEFEDGTHLGPDLAVSLLLVSCFCGFSQTLSCDFFNQCSTSAVSNGCGVTYGYVRCDGTSGGGGSDCFNIDNETAVQ